MQRRMLVLAMFTSLALVEVVHASPCSPFNGTFVAQFDSDVPGPPYPPGYEVRCPTSTLFPVRQCTHGRLFDEAGNQVATYEFGFTSQTRDGDGTLRFTGVSDITLKNGDVIHGHDHGYITPDPAADGQAAAFETTVLPYAVTRSNGTVRPLRTAADTPGTDADVSRIVAGPGGTGSLNVTTGTSSGDYVGQICPRLGGIG